LHFVLVYEIPERVKNPAPQSCRKNRENRPYFFGFPNEIKIAGKRIKFVRVAVIKVREVSHPKALVPPKLLKQKMINPAIKTREV
jgi:hypothetical protein